MMIDSTNIAFFVDTINNGSCIQSHELYSDFKFVAEQSTHFKGPKEREVTYIGASWNLIIFFVVLILIVINKMLSQRKYVAMSFQSRGDGTKLENQSFMDLKSLFVVISFSLMISMFVQKVFLIYSGNHILHSNFGFYFDILLSVVTLFILNYLLTSFYGWLFRTENLIFFHFSSHISVMETCNFVLLPMILLLFFHPYKIFLIIIAVIIFVFFIMHIVKLLMETRMLLKVNFVNIFLYLCTTEILPALVIFRVIMNIV